MSTYITRYGRKTTIKNGNYSDTKYKSKTAKIKPPPHKKRRIILPKQPKLATAFPKDILIYLLSFLRYRKGIILLSKTCKYFKSFINNNPSCIKHYRLATNEHNIDSNKLLKKIQYENINNKSNILPFFHKFTQLNSLELMSIDTSLLKLLNIEQKETIIKLYVENMLIPLQNKLIHLIVNPWNDSALTTNCFSSKKIIFKNVKHICIRGKNVRYPFHITDYTPNIEKLTLVGLGVFSHSLFRMLFDTHKKIKNLMQFCVKNIFICNSDILRIYDSNLKEILDKIPMYDVSELYMDPSGGKLQFIDFIWPHASDIYQEKNFVLLMLFYNQFTVQSLRINYEIFYGEINLKKYNMEHWNGMTEFMEKYNGKKRIYLPKLEYLSLSIDRIAFYEYQRVNYDLLYYKLNVPKLHSIELIPGLMCWHNGYGFIPFLKALIGDQLYKLKNIKIICKDDIDKRQEEYLQISMGLIRQMFQRKKQKIHIEYWK